MREDCFGHKTPTKCEVLTTKNCNGCSFYKTKEDYRKGLKTPNLVKNGVVHGVVNVNSN